MKPTCRIVISMGLLIGLILSAAGCQKGQSDSDQIRRARLVANENIALKKQLEDKDRQIAELKLQIEKLQLQQKKASEETGTATLRLMQMAADSEKRLRATRAENDQLKQQLELLRNQ